MIMLRTAAACALAIAFVQFYPTLFEVAKRMRTVKPEFRDP